MYFWRYILCIKRQKKIAICEICLRKKHYIAAIIVMWNNHNVGTTKVIKNRTLITVEQTVK